MFNLSSNRFFKNPKYIVFAVIALLFITALVIRIALPYDKVFTDDWIKYTGADAYFHMRQVDILTSNFPNSTDFDPYMIYPGGAYLDRVSFFDRSLATVTWIIGLGSPSQRLVDVIGVLFPAILGALTIIPVYFIGRELAGRWAGLLSAGLLAIIPGEFLGRSILGFTDHHIAETLLTATTALFLILAIKSAIKRRLNFDHLKRGDWKTMAKPALYSLLAGTFLGLYILTFRGALLFVFLISIYFIIQFIYDHFKKRSTDYLCLVGSSSIFIALLFSTSLFWDRLFTASMLIALLAPLALNIISRLVTRFGINTIYYPLALIGTGGVGLLVIYLFNPTLLNSMFDAFSIFNPSQVSRTTIEMQPLLFPNEEFSLRIVWGNFTTGFFISIIALFYLAVFRFKKLKAEQIFLIIWSLVMLVAVLSQRRFGYYYAVNVSLLTGFLSWQVLRMVGVKDPDNDESTEEEKAARPGRGPANGRGKAVVVGFTVIVIFFTAYFWNIQPTITTASTARFTPSDAWSNSLAWLKENTADPFGNPDSYYQIFDQSAHGESFNYPQSAYGVMAWWDYGYWITRMAHRIPNANPSQNPGPLTSVATSFTSQNEADATEIVKELGTKYIILDYETAYIDPRTIGGKFWAVILWAGKDKDDFFDVFFLPQEDQVVPVVFFLPKYYYSFSTRLFNFDGKAVTPRDPVVITYQEQENENGDIVKVITSAQQFETYEEAETYRSSQDSDDFMIVGFDPLISPVPLDALEHYELIHSSEDAITTASGKIIPEIKIFEYTE